MWNTVGNLVTYTGVVSPEQCWAGWKDITNQICADGLWTQIVYPKPFRKKPVVVLEYQTINWSDSPCMWNGTDSIYLRSGVYEGNDNAYFQGGASPVNTDCGSAHGFYGRIYVRWTAIGEQ